MKKIVFISVLAALILYKLDAEGNPNGQPILLILIFKGEQLDKGTQSALKEFYNNHTQMADSLIVIKRIYITLYPEEKDYFVAKNLKKYAGRARNIMCFMRDNLNYKGDMVIHFEDEEEFVELDHVKKRVAGHLFISDK